MSNQRYPEYTNQYLPPYEQAQQRPYQSGPPYQQPYSPAYGAPTDPYSGRPARKIGRRVIWIILAVIVGTLVLGAVIAIPIVLTVNSSPATTTARQYYVAIQSQDYQKAYSFLDTSMTTGSGQAISLQWYTDQAHRLDVQQGVVTSYSFPSISLDSSSGAGSTASITVHVTRKSGTSYDVQLELKQEGNAWKIVSLNNI